MNSHARSPLMPCHAHPITLVPSYGTQTSPLPPGVCRYDYPVRCPTGIPTICMHACITPCPLPACWAPPAYVCGRVLRGTAVMRERRHVEPDAQPELPLFRPLPAACMVGEACMIMVCAQLRCDDAVRLLLLPHPRSPTTRNIPLHRWTTCLTQSPQASRQGARRRRARHHRHPPSETHTLWFRARPQAWHARISSCAG